MSEASERKHRQPAGLNVTTRQRVNDRLLFYITVSITGAAVMMIELLGTRIIGPFYGVSLIVWSSLISVALIALSLGYYTGGMLADHSRTIRLSHIVLLAAVCIGLIPLISEPVQTATDILGLRAGAFTSALILFTVPLMLLGMVGPFVIKMAAYRLDDIGSTAGNVYAISTLGSVVGTLVLGFFLLPLAGTRVIILTLSIVLTLLSLILGFYEHRKLKTGNSPLRWATVCLLVIIALTALFFLHGRKTYDDYTVLSDEESYYGWVRVVDDKDRNIRWLMSDSSTIGAEDLHSGSSLLGYQLVTGLLPWFDEQGRELLLIGLGAGHLVKTYGNYGIITDTIEIDPAVANAAKTYFSFKPTGRLILGDARYQIKKIHKQYDFIVHDCFTGGAEPIHMLSLEMITELKKHLKPDGILALNFVGFTREKDLKPVQSVARTLDQVFQNRRTFVSAPGAVFNDFIFVVSDRPLFIAGNNGDGTGDMVDWLHRHEVSVTGKGGTVITDDFNPLENLQIAKAEYYRKLLIERVGKDILFR